MTTLLLIRIIQRLTQMFRPMERTASPTAGVLAWTSLAPMDTRSSSVLMLVQRKTMMEQWYSDRIPVRSVEFTHRAILTTQKTTQALQVLGPVHLFSEDELHLAHLQQSRQDLSCTYRWSFVRSRLFAILFAEVSMTIQKNTGDSSGRFWKALLISMVTVLSTVTSSQTTYSSIWQKCPRSAISAWLLVANTRNLIARYRLGIKTLAAT